MQHAPAYSASLTELLHTSNENGSDNWVWGCVLWMAWLHWEQCVPVQYKLEIWSQKQYKLEIWKRTMFSMIPEQVIWILATSHSRRLKKTSPENPVWLQKWPYFPKEHWEALYHSKIWQSSRARLENGATWVWLPTVTTGKWPCSPWSITCLFWCLSFPNCVTGIVDSSEACSRYQITLWA